LLKFYRMVTRQSAGVLLYRLKNKALEVLLVHPGGPFWKNKDAGSWSIPKGEFLPGENALDAAKRELQEEIGIAFDGHFIELSPVKQKSGKFVYAWALEADIDPHNIHSNNFEIEWPPRSGKIQQFPEIDKGEWFSASEGKQKIIGAQSVLIDELAIKLNLGEAPLKS